MIKLGTNQGLYIGYDSISVLSQSVSLLQAYLLLELSRSSLLAGTGGNRRQPALWYFVSCGWSTQRVGPCEESFKDDKSYENVDLKSELDDCWSVRMNLKNFLQYTSQ